MSAMRNPHRRLRLPMDEDGDGPLWADFWMNLAIIFIVTIVAAQTANKLMPADVTLASSTGDPGTITMIHLAHDETRGTTLRLGGTAGPVIADDAALAEVVTGAMAEDPSGIFVIAALGHVPYSAFIATRQRLAAAGVGEVSVTETPNTED